MRAQFNGQWYTLTYNEDARAYQTAITPDTFSGGQPDGYYDVTVEATNDSGVVVTTDGGNLPGLRLVVRETIPPILTLVSPEAGYVTTNTPAVTWTAQDNDGGSGIDPDSAMVKLDGKAVPAEQVSVTAGRIPSPIRQGLLWRRGRTPSRRASATTMGTQLRWRQTTL